MRVHVLDHAVHERLRDKATGCVYQRSCFHALGRDGVAERIEEFYRPL
ncbi:hypothetical protein [Kitasatospora sp. NPDC056181]